MSKQLKGIQSPRGMHDILPEDQKYWRYILKKSEPLLDFYSYEKIETPVVEATELFVRGVGEATDLVQKEMYTFRTKGGDSLTLRPEGTAPVVRAYLEHGMTVWPHPVKLYYLEAMYRHEEPQHGRYRQHYQLGAEVLGDGSEIIDTELIFLAYKIAESIGLKGYVIHINSLGDQNCRPAYLKALRDYYRPRTKKLCANCKLRIKENVLRMLDCKEEGCQELAKEAPQIMDYLDDACKLHFRHVLEYLEELKIPYVLNPYLIRGQDYYTRTLFEIVPEENATPQSSLGGGGRYDRLVDLLGGPKTPAAGFAMGIERLILALKEQNIEPTDPKPKTKAFLVQLGDAPKRKSLGLMESFRKAGIEIKSSLGRDNIKAQLRIAHRLGARFALIFGQKEALDGTIILREMDTGIQETIPLEKIVDEVKKRLKTYS